MEKLGQLGSAESGGRRQGAGGVERLASTRGRGGSVLPGVLVLVMVLLWAGEGFAHEAVRRSG